MRPEPLVVEFPDRPVYRPGSGPPMAAVTLTPDNTETGWIIDDIVEFQGVPQYVITPKHNPAHRKPVKKERILDWVSAKTYEDFEYARYTKQTEEEWEIENKLLEEGAKIKERIFGATQAKRQAMRKAPRNAPSKPTSRLELRRNGRVSISESGNESSEAPTTRRLSAKRRHPQEDLGEPSSVVKRRAVSNSSQGLTLQPKSPSMVRTTQTAIESDSGSDFNGEKGESIASEVYGRDHTRKENDPMRPPQKDFRGSLTGFTSGKAIISRPSSVHTSPQPRWSVLGPPIRVSVVLPKSPVPVGLSQSILVTDGTLKERSSNRKDYSAILPPGRAASARSSTSKPAFFPKNASGPPLFARSVGSESLDGSHSFGESEESPIAAKSLRSSRRKVFETSKPTPSQNVIQNLHAPESALAPRQRKAANNGKLAHHSKEIRREKKTQPSIRKQSNKGKGREVPQPKSELMARRKPDLEAEMQGAVVEDEVEEDEETWEIHGVLDGEIRTINGRKIRYYLCSWVGEYEPTWEPAYNVSQDSINEYNKSLVSGLGFDGASDMAGPSNSNSREHEDAIGEDSDLMSEALAEAQAFLRPFKGPDFDAIVAGGVKGDFNLHPMQMREANRRAESYL